MLHPVGKQAYKLKLPKKWKIHDVFHILLLEQNITRKEWEFSVPEFESGDDKKYKMEAIRDSAVYAKEVDGHLPGLYYLIAWKGYSEEESTQEPSSAIMYLRKMVSTSTRTTRKSRQRHQYPWTLLCPWPSQRSSSLQSESEGDQPDVLRSNTSNEATKKRRQGGIWVSAVLRAKSRRVVRDLSCWHKERYRGACMVVNHGSSIFEELHNILFWPSPLLSKSFIDQTTSLLSPPISVFPFLFFVQVRRFFHQ